MDDWLTEFVTYGTYGEASPRLMYWVGVSTLAAALRRKVWLDFRVYEWSPNFYILVVGPPGTVRKSTSIDIGMQLLAQVDGINIGPSSVTWQALIQEIAQIKESVPIGEEGELFEMSSITLALSEFGTFFDPENRELIDQLTDLWDGKRGTVKKMTKTAGCDEMVNPWINIIAGTTPNWLAKNFGENLVGGGLAGRMIFLYGEMPTKDIGYPDEHMPPGWFQTQQHLVEKLRVIAEYAGPFTMTKEARAWGNEWYSAQRKELREMGNDSLESGFLVRKQVHLHKLAMVISAARLNFPSVGLEHMVEAEQQLNALDADTRKVFGYVGQNKITSASRQIVEVITNVGPIGRRELYRTRFFRTMSSGEFDEAVRSAIQAELVLESDGVANPVLMARRTT